MNVFIRFLTTREDRIIPNPSLEQAVLFPNTSPTERVRRRDQGRRSTKAEPRKKSALEPHVSAALENSSGVVFLDVETTGLSWFYDELTLVGWACDGSYDVHVAGEDPARLLSALTRASALVTFNGTLFDLKFLKKTFGEIALPPVHVDLRYLSKRAGLTGGQKIIETELGIGGRAGVEDLDGAAAVLLWHEFVRGDGSALERLVDYNRRDVLAMCMIKP